MENKLAMIAILAAALVAATAVQSAQAQYGTSGNPTAAPTQEQLEECEKYNINKSECNEHTILAKRRVVEATNNPNGSGTPLLSITGEGTWTFIGLLGAVFGGISAAFFLRGRKAAA